MALVGRVGAAVCGLLSLAAAAGAQTFPEPTVVVAIGGGRQGAPDGFGEQFREPLFVETAQYDTRYEPGASGVFELGAGVRVWRAARVGAAFTRTSERLGATIDGRLPHPFRFGDPRSVQGTRDGLARTEQAWHLQVAWRHQLTPRIDVDAFLGPSWFSVDEDVIDTVLVDEAYPYDVVTFAGARTRHAAGSAAGLHAGLDVQYRLTPLLGVGGGVRFSRATVTLEPGQGRRVDVSAGGVWVSAGLRVGF